jgi:hypothetical protein
MKKFIISSIVLTLGIVLSAQDGRTVILQNLENNKAGTGDIRLSATLKSTSRLFGDKNDLTSVITIIPSGTVLDVLASDSTYLNVIFEDTTGYVFKRHAAINASNLETKPVVRQEAAQTQEQTQQSQPVSRFSYLENKYGTNMAARLVAGKIWKGMNAEMIRDSWGTPKKINRVISGNTIKEEWIFNNTWLYVENDRLVEWGPIRR